MQDEWGDPAAAAKVVGLDAGAGAAAIGRAAETATLGREVHGVHIRVVHGRFHAIRAIDVLHDQVRNGGLDDVRAIVLRTTHKEIGVLGCAAETVELGDGEAGGKIRPVVRAIGAAVYTAVAAAEERAAIVNHLVDVRVGVVARAGQVLAPVGGIGPGRAAIDGFPHVDAAYVDLVHIGGAHIDGEVIPRLGTGVVSGLAVAEDVGGGGHGGPGRAAVHGSVEAAESAGADVAACNRVDVVAVRA